MKNIDQLFERASDEALGHSEFIAYAESQELNIVECVNSFSIELAKRFMNKQYDYSFCDGVANWLMSFLTSDWFLSKNNNTVPSPAWDVFLAFDAGEYQHQGDCQSVIPHEKYTVPEITKILSNENS